MCHIRVRNVAFTFITYKLITLFDIPTKNTLNDSSIFFNIFYRQAINTFLDNLFKIKIIKKLRQSETSFEYVSRISVQSVKNKQAPPQACRRWTWHSRGPRISPRRGPRKWRSVSWTVSTVLPRRSRGRRTTPHRTGAVNPSLGLRYYNGIHFKKIIVNVAYDTR